LSPLGKNLYAFGWACLGAVAAVGALFVVYLRKIIFNHDCFFGALAHTFAAAKATFRASFARCRSFFDIAASNKRFLPGVFYCDNFIGACFYAYPATCAEISVYAGKAVLHTNSVFRASDLAVAITQTAVRARTLAAKDLLCRITSLYACIGHLFLLCCLVAPAVNNGNLAHRRFGFNAENFAYTRYSVRSTGRAEVALYALARNEGVGVARTAGETARATVSARQSLLNFLYPLVNLNMHNLRGYA